MYCMEVDFLYFLGSKWIDPLCCAKWSLSAFWWNFFYSLCDGRRTLLVVDMQLVISTHLEMGVENLNELPT